MKAGDTTHQAAHARHKTETSVAHIKSRIDERSQRYARQCAQRSQDAAAAMQVLRSIDSGTTAADRARVALEARGFVIGLFIVDSSTSADEIVVEQLVIRVAVII